MLDKHKGGGSALLIANSPPSVFVLEAWVVEMSPSLSPDHQRQWHQRVCAGAGLGLPCVHFLSPCHFQDRHAHAGW